MTLGPASLGVHLVEVCGDLSQLHRRQLRHRLLVVALESRLAASHLSRESAHLLESSEATPLKAIFAHACECEVSRVYALGHVHTWNRRTAVLCSFSIQNKSIKAIVWPAFVMTIIHALTSHVMVARSRSCLQYVQTNAHHYGHCTKTWHTQHTNTRNKTHKRCKYTDIKRLYQ